LRQISDETVFDALVAGGAATRAELAAATGISKPTVSQAVRRLAEAGLLAEQGVRSGRRGGVGTIYDVATGAGVVLAAELNQRGVAARAVDLAGRLVREVAQAPTSDPTALGANLRRAVEQAADGARILAAGVSLANPVDPATHRVVRLPDTPFPAGIVQPVEVLADVVAGPVLVDNDVNLAALAERRLGLGAAVDSFAFLYLGGGLGAALYVGDVAVRGAHGLAGELGYLPVRAGSGQTLAHRLSGTGPEDAPTLDIATVVGVLAGSPTRARTALINRLAEAAASAAMSVAAVADPALIVLGGPVGVHPALESPIRGILASSWPGPVEVARSTLGATAVLEGAALAAGSAARRFVLAGVGKTSP
jgi:predicted NBD/HSP70 family sugar kinase